MTPLGRLRRGVALLFLAAGPLHWAWLVFAGTAALQYAYFLILVVGGMLYLTVGFARSGLFLYEALMDFLIGVGLFVVTAGVPWLAGAALTGYGAWRFARIATP